MKAFVLVFFFAFVPVAAHAGTPCPTAPGVFYLSGSEWMPLQAVSVSGFAAHGIAKSAFSYGIASSKSVMVYRDAKAPVALSGTPQFCLATEVGLLRNLVVVRVAAKKDHRELQTGKANMYTGVKVEYRPEDIQPVTLVAQSRSASIVTPKASLKPGQYVIFPQTETAMPGGYGGFDFGVE